MDETNRFPMCLDNAPDPPLAKVLGDKLWDLQMYERRLRKALKAGVKEAVIEPLGFQGYVKLRNKRLIKWALETELKETKAQIEELEKQIKAL